MVFEEDMMNEGGGETQCEEGMKGYMKIHVHVGPVRAITRFR